LIFIVLFFALVSLLVQKQANRILDFILFVFTSTSQCTDLFRVDPFRLSCSVFFLEKLSNVEACSLHEQKRFYFRETDVVDHSELGPWEQ